EQMSTVSLPIIAPISGWDMGVLSLIGKLKLDTGHSKFYVTKKL
ncbi:14136_t:CDS:1, partial [Ambispora leptoticha]